MAMGFLATRRAEAEPFRTMVQEKGQVLRALVYEELL
jgi:hypothetical protein